MTICDVDEFTSQMVGWESDWRQLETGPTRNRIDTFTVEGTVLQRVRLSHAIHQQGKAPDHLVTFGVPELTGLSVWRGREIPNFAIFDFNNASGYDCVSGQGFSGLSLSFPREVFNALADRYELEATSLLDGRVWDFQTDPGHALHDMRQTLCCLVDRLASELHSDTQREVMNSLVQGFPERLVAAMAASTRCMADQPLKNRQRGLRKAVDFMEAHCHLNPSIPEVSNAVGLSWRTLDRASRESFGIGPKRYMLNLRLTRVRRDLRYGPDELKVADIANRWGFWHMGDFAREYRKLFDELPAQTLARK